MIGGGGELGPRTVPPARKRMERKCEADACRPPVRSAGVALRAVAIVFYGDHGFADVLVHVVWATPFLVREHPDEELSTSERRAESSCSNAFTAFMRHS